MIFYDHIALIGFKIINLNIPAIDIIIFHLIIKEALQGHFCYFINLICLSLKILINLTANLVSFVLQIQECNLFS